MRHRELVWVRLLSPAEQLGRPLGSRPSFSRSKVDVAMVTSAFGGSEGGYCCACT